MTAPIDLRGSGRDFAQALASLGAGVSNIINPNQERQRQLKEAILADPSLAAKLAEQERNNPGFLSDLGIGEDFAQRIIGVPRTTEQLVGGITRPGLTPVEEGGRLTPEISATLADIGAAGEFGVTPSEIAREPRVTRAVTETPQEAFTRGETARAAGGQPGQLAADDFRAGIFQLVQEGLDQIEPDEAKRAALRAELPSLFLEEDERLAHTRRLEIANLQIDAQNIDRARERQEAFRRNVAVRWQERTNAGTPEAWEAFVFDVDLNKRAKDLQLGTVSPDNDFDLGLLEVANAFDNARQAEKISDVAAAQRQVELLIGRIESRDPEDRGKFLLDRRVRAILTEQLNKAMIELTTISSGDRPLDQFFIPEGGNKPLESILPPESELSRQDNQPSADFQQLDFSTVDPSRLSPISRENLRKLVNGEGTLEELQRVAPNSAQEILNAVRR